MSSMRWCLELVALVSVHCAGATSWIGITGDRNKELTKCAANFGGPVKFFPASAWPHSETGSAVCAKEKAGACSKVIDWQCNVLPCSSSVEMSRLAMCAGTPGPPAPPAPPPPPTPPPAFPFAHSCRKGHLSAPLPFCDAKLDTATRVKDLVNRMSLPDKCKMTGDGATVGGGGILSLGIQPYSWNTEALHGLAAACLEVNGTTRCPTVFPAPPGLGSTFNLSVPHSMGVVIGDEARAMNNMHGCRARGGGGCGMHNGNWYIGLNVWVPNLNIYRDPRWGRNIEVPTEDPWYSGEYGTSVIEGVQWEGSTLSPSGRKYTKINAALKHFFAYSVESGRGSTDFNISQHDIYDTYLPSFEAPIVQADAKGYMCAYTSVNGQPSCGSEFLSGTARHEWNFSGYVVSDCGGVNDITGYEHVNDTEGAAIGLRDGGVDINCGGGLTNHICSSIHEGLVDESVLDASLERSFTLLFDAGMFDPLEAQPFTKIGFDQIGSAHSRQAALDASRQALVLLKNAKASLPLKKTASVLLSGPHATTQQDLGGNYFEDICPHGGDCVPSMQDAIGNVTSSAPRVVPGCADTACASPKLGTVTAAAKTVDAVVIAVGLVGRPKIMEDDASTGSLHGSSHELPVSNPSDGSEGEGHDRTSIALPDGQVALVNAILDAVKPGTPVTLVLFNGGGIAIEQFMADSRVTGIIEAFYPGVSGATAVAESLFGLSNRFSKMPYTLLAADYIKESVFKDMSMTDPPGRGYRYYRGKNDIVPFGFGLSYTTFALKWEPSGSAESGAASTRLSSVTIPHGAAQERASMHSPARVLRGDGELVTTVKCVVTNTGRVQGDEIVFLFHNATAAIRSWADATGNSTGSLSGPGPSDPLAMKQLIGFQRVTLAPGASSTLTFPVSLRKLSTVDARGVRQTLSGEHRLIISRGHGPTLEKRLLLQMQGKEGAMPQRIVLGEPRS